MQEVRRRLWWQLIVLDIRCCEDRGSEPLISKSSFNTRQPLNINDSDMNPSSTQPIIERVGFTEMTKPSLSHKVSRLAWDFAWTTEVSLDEEGKELEGLTFDKKMERVDNLEKRVQNEVLVYCDPKIPVAWVTSVVARLIMCRLRLAIYHHVKHDDRPSSGQEVSRKQLLMIAIETVEYSHLLDTNPDAAQWRWFFKTYVQWHGLAITLAGLCVHTQGPLVERAWRIVDVVFDDWAARVADSRTGMLWRPMKKLMSKAQAKRAQTKSLRLSAMAPPTQKSLPSFDPTGFSVLDSGDFKAFETEQAPSPVPSYTSSGPMEMQQHQPISADAAFADLSVNDLNRNDSNVAINWAEFDEFLQDFEMGEPIVGEMEMATLQPELKARETWW